MTCVCGAKETEVHRVRCPVWLKNPVAVGPLRCRGCGSGFSSLINGLCKVCDYWRFHPENETKDLTAGPA